MDAAAALLFGGKRGAARRIVLGLVVKNLGLPLVHVPEPGGERAVRRVRRRARGAGPPAVGGGGGGAGTRRRAAAAGGKAARARKKPSGRVKVAHRRGRRRASAVWMRSSRAGTRRCGGRSGLLVTIVIAVIVHQSEHERVRARKVTRRRDAKRFPRFRSRLDVAFFFGHRSIVVRHRARPCFGTKTTTRVHASARAFERAHRARLRIPRRSSRPLSRARSFAVRERVAGGRASAGGPSHRASARSSRNIAFFPDIDTLRNRRAS